ncbi:hypothetical protein DRH13_06845, partial [Candidatus Woesebacteria bacterium]
MEIEIDSKRNNPLLNRTEIYFTVKHTGEGTPNREIIRSELADKLNIKKENIVVSNVQSGFGTQEISCYAKVYSSLAKTKDIEQDYILKRNKLIGGEKPEKKAEEKPPEPPKQEISEEKPTEAEPEVPIDDVKEEKPAEEPPQTSEQPEAPSEPPVEEPPKEETLEPAPETPPEEPPKVEETPVEEPAGEPTPEPAPVEEPPVEEKPSEKTPA